jgi:hypothetical protein
MGDQIIRLPSRRPDIEASDDISVGRPRFCVTLLLIGRDVLVCYLNLATLPHIMRNTKKII